MKIGIDSRMYGPSVGGGGLGRYVEQLVEKLQVLDSKNRYVLFLKEENIAAPSENFQKVLADIHWYGMQEQLKLPNIIDEQNLDLIHFPHWNVPLSIKTPFVVTIHDLILLEQPRSARITTRNALVYQAKYQIFKRVLKHALTKSKKIIAVSNYTKRSIQEYFPEIPSDKISVVYEGMTDLRPDHFTSETKRSKHLDHIPAHEKYFLYVGNAYPHKNLESLLHAFSFFHKLHPDIHLVLAGRSDVFYQRLRKELQEIDVPESVVTFVMNPTDHELALLYQHASVYLFPSKCEGFGLPPLEAMSFGVPVLASNASCLPEILGQAALYFSPDDIEEMVSVMEKVISDDMLMDEMSRRGQTQVKQYSWTQMAKEIQSIYESCA
jgi:glycosyltransferase involved in cell wall biosynthesis